MNSVYKPELFRTARATFAARGLGKVGAYPVYDSESGDVLNGDTWLSSLPQIVTTAQTAWNAQRVFDINLDRAQRGLAPLNPSLTAPTVNVGLSAGTQSTLLLIGAALLAVMLLRKKA